jgi:hypothetical protein
VRLEQPDQSVPQQEQILTDDDAHRNLDLNDRARRPARRLRAISCCLTARHRGI